MELQDEFNEYIASEDYDLIIRRLMDLCFESEDEAKIKEVIDIKKNYDPSNTSWSDSIKHLSKNFGNVHIEKAIEIKAENLSKVYTKGKFQLSDITCEFKSGEIVGVVGENGNGKTTLLRMLANQLSFTNGQISISSMQEMNNYEKNSNIAFIPQRIPRWYGKLKDNLHFAASTKSIVGEKNDLYVNYILERFNLSQYANLTWDQISSGYKTRFEIAKIILQRPRILILDEPLANLDINAQQTLLTDLKMIAKTSKNQMCIVLSSQQLYEVEKIADKIIMLKNGFLINTSFDNADQLGSIIELETNMPKSKIESLFDQQTSIVNNGAYFTITSNKNANEIVKILIHNDIPITYFRDISRSTKRLFQK